MGKDMGDPLRNAALRRLLSLYEGVVVDRVWCHPSGSANIMLRISNPESLGRLANFAQNTNVAFLVWADAPGDSWAERVLYELRAEPDPEGTEYPAVEHLCGNMIYDLVCRGMLDQAEAEKLLGG
jgi:hypothetical protein